VFSNARDGRRRELVTEDASLRDIKHPHFPNRLPIERIGEQHHRLGEAFGEANECETIEASFRLGEIRPEIFGSVVRERVSEPVGERRGPCQLAAGCDVAGLHVVKDCRDLA
jgi:hypothetical protein